MSPPLRPVHWRSTGALAHRSDPGTPAALRGMPARHALSSSQMPVPTRGQDETLAEKFQLPIAHWQQHSPRVLTRTPIWAPDARQCPNRTSWAVAESAQRQAFSRLRPPACLAGGVLERPLSAGSQDVMVRVPASAPGPVRSTSKARAPSTPERGDRVTAFAINGSTVELSHTRPIGRPIVAPPENAPSRAAARGLTRPRW
jgi:hypothetical protein